MTNYYKPPARLSSEPHFDEDCKMTRAMVDAHRKFERPLCFGTLKLIRDEVEARNGSIYSPYDVCTVFDGFLVEGDITEFNRAWKQAQEQADYSLFAASTPIVIQAAINQKVFLDNAGMLAGVINLYGKEQQWPLSSAGETKEQQQAKDNRRQRIIDELTKSGTKGFTIVQPVGSDRAGWTTKRVNYDSLGRELKVDTQGRHASGWVPIAGDRGFDAMSTEQIEQLMDAVKLKRQLMSSDKKEVANVVRDLRADSPTVRFGSEVVKRQKQQNDDAFFASPETGAEYTRQEIMHIIKNNLPLYKRLCSRDLNRVNAILQKG
jgi:hypothetical protein